MAWKRRGVRISHTPPFLYGAARVVKLVYTYALGAYAFGRAGSSPVSRTRIALKTPPETGGCFFIDLGAYINIIFTISEKM